MPSPIGSRRLVRIAVYAMLVTSAATTLLLGERLWSAAGSGSVPLWSALVPMVTFTAFVAVYSVDRYMLVRRRSYPLVRALLQVALALAFLTFLWPQQASELRAVRKHLGGMHDIGRLLAYRDPLVRAAACELAGLRGDDTSLARMTLLARTDKHPAVRTACNKAIDLLGAADAP